MEEVKKLTLSEKLRACADAGMGRYKEKHGEEARAPGHLRLMYSAASVIDSQDIVINELKGQNQKLLRVLAANASCDTCKSGPAKQCAVRGECGDDHGLWQFNDA